MRMKPLPPSQREPRRYLFFACEASGRPEAAEVEQTVSESARALFGEASSAAAHLGIVRFDGYVGALRCVRGHEEVARAALAAAAWAGGCRVAFWVMHTSGTLKGGMERFMCKKAALEDELEREIVAYGQRVGISAAAKSVAVDLSPHQEALPKRTQSPIVGLTIFDPSGR